MLSVSLGIHSGKVTAGIAGYRTPRFCVFGETVNAANKIAQNSIVSISLPWNRI